MNDSLAKRYGFQVLAAGWLALFCLFGYRAIFAMLKGPMASEMGWNSAQVTLGYSIMMVFYALTSLVCGKINDKWGPRPAYFFGALLGAIGFYGTSLMSGYMAYLIVFGIIGGIGTGMLWISATVSARQWYVGATFGKKFALVFMGGPMAQILLSLLVRRILANGDADAWRVSMRVLALIILVALLIAAFIVKRKPETYGAKPFGDLPAPAGSKPYIWKMSAAFKTFPLWTCIVAFLSSQIGEFLIWTQTISYWRQDLKMSLDAATNMYVLIGIVGIFAIPLYGVFADKLVQKFGNEAKGRKIAIFISALIGIFACIMLLMQSQVPFLGYVAAIAFAVYWGAIPSCSVGYTASIYGRATLGAIWGTCTLIVNGIGPFTGSFVGGYLADISGSYTYSIYFAMGSFVISGLVATIMPLSVKTPELKQKEVAIEQHA
jgi:MFS family permease